METFLLVFAHFVCPLLFFTDLTRNPYFTQIALLNVALLGAGAWWTLRQAFAPEGEAALRLPRTPLDAPIGLWLLVCLVSWLLAYFGHAAFFRDSMRSEGLRVGLFTVVNTVIPFYLAVLSARGSAMAQERRLGRWAAFSLIWGAGWLAFASLRAPGAASLSAWAHLWDGYGGFLWAAGLGVAWRLARGGSLHELWHLCLSVAFVSSVYGIFQYMNVEWIWPKVLNPYGGRSVSTFGNPNFMSSYYVMLLPVAAAYYLDARSAFARLAYAAVFLAMEGALLCSLTRSSWAGALAALATLALAPGVRRRLQAGGLELHGLVATAAVAMLVFWPRSPVGTTPTVLERVTELGQIFEAGGGSRYSPMFQRVLIWTCAWMMGRESFLLGKGWGLFELYYPFYQGHVLVHFDWLRNFRTHANNAHNEWLELFAQTGIAGVGANLWLWAVFFACVGRWFPRAEPAAALAAGKGAAARPAEGSAAEAEAQRPLWAWAAAAAALGMLVDNLLNVSMHFAVPAFLLWWQVGTAVGLGREHPAGPWREKRLPSWAAKVAALGLAGLALWGSHHWWRQWNREVNYFLGFKLMRGTRMAAAVERLEAAHRWHPREVNANYELGNAYARSERYDKASSAYSEALKANAGYDEIYFNKGTVLLQRLNQPEEALLYLRTAHALNPHSYDITAALTAALLREPEKRREEAVRVLELAIRVFPDDAGFRNNLGTLYNRGGDRERALELWTEALRKAPELPQAEQNILALARKAGLKPPKVLEEVRAYRELESRIAAKDFGKPALELARRVFESFPASPKARYYRGNLELLHGDAGVAAELLGPIARLDPRNVGLQLNLAQAFARLGRRDEAVAAVRRALQAEPGNPQAQAMLKALGL